MIFADMLTSIRQRMMAYTVALTASPVQFGLWIMAFWFASNGPAAYLTCPSMLSDPMTPCLTYVLGSIPVTVNLCHALCHFVSGVLGLVAVLRRSWATAYAMLCALYYFAWGFVGVFGGAHIRYHLGVDVFGSWVHVVEGSILLAIWVGDRLMTRSADRPEAVTTSYADT